MQFWAKPGNFYIFQPDLHSIEIGDLRTLFALNATDLHKKTHMNFRWVAKF